jgi:hypothetical protein
MDEASTPNYREPAAELVRSAAYAPFTVQCFAQKMVELLAR